MIGRLTVLAAAGALVCAPAWAQEERYEISGNVGWTASDGVSSQVTIRGGDGNLYNRVDPKDAFSWGITAGYFFTENWEFELQYAQQQSTLQIGGTASRDIGDSYNVRNYHGLFNYHFLESGAVARPFLFIGLGATSYPGVDFTTVGGQRSEIGGNTKFSSTLGAGVKVYPGKKAGLRLQVRWTPTYIKSDSAGWWCDPYWGCYVAGDAQYSNQFEMSGGLTLRF